MNVFAIADLHLGLGIDKKMDIFGPAWLDHPSKIKNSWVSLVGREDLVLIPGDISWAISLDQARADIDFISMLPGKKVIIRGNHDYWWSTLTKLNRFLPEDIVPIHNTSFVYRGVGVAGTRLWIEPELRLEASSDSDEKIYKRELERLRMSISSLPGGLEKIVVMTHFPPISIQGEPGRAVRVVEEYYTPDVWVFGHMHLDGSGSKDYHCFNRVIGKTRYEFVSADFLGFKPRLILDL